MEKPSTGFRVFVEEIYLSTKERIELVDITNKVEEAVQESKIRNGICLVYAPHATAAIILNEHEKGLLSDIVKKILEIAPPGANYLHNRIDNNAHAHVASSIIGSSATLPVVNGELVRGTWQNIFLVELDGPRASRRIIVEVLGE
jgi:secondary thiamine-phosphate synthase enzyme